MASLLWSAVSAGLGMREPAETSVFRAEEATWLALTAEARRLRVAPLVYAGLQTSDAGRIPRDAREALRRATLRAGARAVHLEETAASIIEAAIVAGIPTLLLKGLALQTLTYPAGIVRPMDDVDLLVSPADRPRLCHLLRRQGYRSDLRGEEDFFAPDLSHSIDVHTHLVNTTRVPARGVLWDEPFQAFWERRQALPMGGVSAWTLGARDTLQHLAIHAVHHHGLQGVLWMADLLAASRTWSAALFEVRDAPLGVRRSVWYCLEILAARQQDAAPTVRAALRPRRLFPGERRILSLAARRECTSHIRYGLTLACLPGWTSRGAFARQLIFPSAAVNGAGFADAGPRTPHTWIRHWKSVGRLVRKQIARRNRTS